MRGRIAESLTFALERWIQRGVVHQLLLMAALIALVAVVGGTVAWLATPRFANAPEAIWWAFLRLTDPGYLGDDEGVVLRTISTVVTVLGYVLFMGSLIAIMTQWLATTMRQLERGLTPIAMQNHVVILGWTNRTPEVVAKLLGARGRLDRFLDDRGTRTLRVVVLSDDVGPERRLEMRDYLGELWDDRKIFLRSGSSLRPEHLGRLDLSRAAVVILPGSDFELGGSELTDARVVKTLLTMRALFQDRPGEQRPQVVAEVFDSEKLAVAHSAMGESIEAIPTDRVISRLVSQSIRHRGMAEVLFGLLTHREGNSLYLRAFPELAGHTPRALTPVFSEAIVLGFVRMDAGVWTVNMDPASPEVVRDSDLLVLLAESYAQCRPAGAPAAAAPAVAASPADLPEVDRRVLVLGWSHKVARFIAELSESGGRFEVTIVSRVDSADRRTELERVDYDAQRVTVNHVRADYSIERDLARVRPASYDYVLFVASGGMETSEGADARTVLGYVLMRAMLADVADPPEVLIEMVDPGNARPIEGASRGLVLVSPQVMSHVLAHVALRPELNAVFDALFCSGGTEFDLWPVGAFDLEGRTVGFAEIQTAALARGVVAIGIRTRDRQVNLNPDRARSWTLGADDQLIVLTTLDVA